ncbi:maltose ABC transporter permease MalF [Natronospirillum operosum]|uniref:Maltose/maltodextrin transport system permease protein n=1 Tax=Natronospirillum operosum TaxID=2759953 RepID=A0A4Z0WFD8_9GAMM|nr:maltose ABC transporter permease MalF [Natronospirillum operosum]TGG93258.1 maltose ABC transporter permease MalF [Natronospirillum operosum]
MADANAIPIAPDSARQGPARRIAHWLFTGLLGVGMFWVATLMFFNGDLVFAVGMTFLAGLLLYLYLNPRIYVGRYVFPGLAGIGIFTLFPLLYSVYISFTNYGDGHMVTHERATQYHLSRTYLDEAGTFDFELHPAEDERYRMVLRRDGDKYISAPVALAAIGEGQRPLIETRAVAPGSLATEALSLRDVLANRSGLQRVVVELPHGTELRYSGPRAFGALRERYQQDADDPHVLHDQQTGGAITADFERGYYVDDEGNRVRPGFTTHVGWDNYTRIFTDRGMMAPFFEIFVWTIFFGAVTVFVAYGLGVTLACLLNWKLIRGSVVYRILMILPYAVPAFISIQIFRGLFNQNFGEINLILEVLFGLRPAWFTEPALARTMVLITNIWLGYPYMMILALGMLQSVPDDLYEAAHIEGSGVINNFFRITLPLITRPLIPLLIAAFAFNFNNLVVIQLLTEGGPNIVGSNPNAGHTDLLVNYAFRLAFQDGTQEFGLAAAITTLIFLLVAGLSMLYIRHARIEMAR